MNLENIKILYIVKGKEPSAFVRALVYREEFKNRNIHVDFFRLHSNFFSKKNLLLNKIKGYDIIIAIKYIESEILREIKLRSKALLVFDFDDSIWLSNFFGEEEFSKRVSFADYTTSDNSFLASYASKYNKNSFVVNGPCQIEKFMEYNKSENKQERLNNSITIGWIGSNSTLFYLYKIYDALEIIGEKYPNVKLKIVGTREQRQLIPPFEKIKVETVAEYNQLQMIENVHSFDIGVYPLFLNELSLGRGSLKATIYMAGGIPLVCSAIGENTKIIKNGFNGFIANGTEEWVEKLSILIENPQLRENIGENGFNFAKANYSIESCANQLLDILYKATN